MATAAGLTPGNAVSDAGAAMTMVVGIAGMAVATTACCAALGFYAHRRGFLSENSQRAMEKLIVEIFLPCLILGKVIPHMDMDQLMKVWPLVMTCALLVAFGLWSGYVVSSILERWYPSAFPKYRGLVMVASAFPNAFAVPMTLCLSLCEYPAVFERESKDVETMKAQVMLLFVMSYAVWVLARWTIGYPILSGAISCEEWVSKVWNAPTKACLVAVVLGLAYDLAMPTLVHSSWARLLTPAVVAVDYGGRCSAPLLLFALGATLDKAVAEVSASAAEDEIELSSSSESEDASQSEPESSATLPTIAYPVVIILRQVLGSAVSATIAILLRNLLGVRDPVVLMVAMTQGAGPPMVCLSLMSGLTGKAEVEASKVLLACYGTSVFTWTMSLSVFLKLLG